MEGYGCESDWRCFRSDDLRTIILILFLSVSAWSADVVDTIDVADNKFRDNWMFSNLASQDWNQGAHIQWNIGEWESGSATFRQWFFVKFPADVDVVVACTLVYTVILSQIAADSMHIYRILPYVNPVWEGNNSDANADINEMSWNARAEQPGQTDSTWNTAGCSGVGTDYVNTIIGAGDVDLGENTTAKMVIDSAVVDSMATGELPNNGFLVISNEQVTISSRSQLGSTENATPAYRPFVILAYNIVVGEATRRRREEERRR